MENKYLKFEIINEYNLKIYQDDRFFKYGLDSVELAKFVYKNENTNNNKKMKVIDVCSGSGIVGLIIQRMFNLEKIFFLEKQKYFAELNKKNAEENLMKDSFEILNMDLINIKDKEVNKFENTFDIITVNPPYKKYNSGINSLNIEKTIAKKEEENFLESLFKFSKKILKDNGKIYMVNRPDRIVDICFLARKYKIEPKIMQIVTNDKNVPKLILIQFTKNGGEFLKILKNKMIK